MSASVSCLLRLFSITPNASNKKTSSENFASKYHKSILVLTLSVINIVIMSTGIGEEELILIDPSTLFDKQEQIGEGSFGTVYKG
jgi:hypothetical protein